MKMNTLVQPEKNGHVEESRAGLPPSDERFIRLMLVYPDREEAVRRVAEHAGQEFDAKHAPEMEVLQREGPVKDERAAVMLDELHTLEEQRRANPSSLIVPPGDKQRCSFAQWTLKDQATLSSSLIFMVIVLAAGAGNVYSAIQAEAIPIFLEHPLLAMLLSCLLPSGASALHSFPELLQSERHRQQYNKLIATLTFAFLVIWAWLFALQFQIGDDTLSAATLNEPTDQTSVWYTAVQLLTELFCGAFLALVASHIHSRYSQDTTIPNPEAAKLDQLIAQARARYEAALARQRAWGRLAQLKAMRGLCVNERVALFVASARRYEELSKMTSYQGGLR